MVWAHRHRCTFTAQSPRPPVPPRPSAPPCAPHVLHVAGEVGLLDGVEVRLLDGMRAADRTHGFQPLLIVVALLWAQTYNKVGPCQ